MRLPRGRTAVAGLLAAQCIGLGYGFHAVAGSSSAASPGLAPDPSTSSTPPSSTPGTGWPTRSPTAPGVPTTSPPPGPASGSGPDSAPGSASDSAPGSAPGPRPAALPVAPLGAVVVPDVLVLSRTPLSAAQVTALRAATRATAALLLDAGTVRLGSGTTTALGVDPSTFRGWTPTGTAASTPLWQSVARGDLAVSYAVARAQDLPLGGTTTVAGTTGRIGAFASTELPGVGVVVARSTDAPLHLVRSSALLLAAQGQDPVVTAAVARRTLGAGGTATATRVPSTGGRLQWVAPAAGPVTSPFGPRDDPSHPGSVEFHAGVDIGAPLGAPIYAAAAGVVQYAGPAQGYGQEVVLQHAGNVTTVYGHMEEILVTSGPVAAGQPIALVGAEGDATGPHLHFEVHVDDQLVDPLTWLVDHGVRVDR